MLPSLASTHSFSFCYPNHFYTGLAKKKTKKDARSMDGVPINNLECSSYRKLSLANFALLSITTPLENLATQYRAGICKLFMATFFNRFYLLILCYYFTYKILFCRTGLISMVERARETEEEIEEKFRGWMLWKVRLVIESTSWNSKGWKSSKSVE